MFYVIQIDDEGTRRVVDGAASAVIAARRAAALDERIDANAFAASWNVAVDGVRYEIGVD